MSDRFHPLTMEQLTAWVFDELEQQNGEYEQQLLHHKLKKRELKQQLKQLRH